MKKLIKKIREQIEYDDYPERMDPKTERTLGDPERNLYGTNPAMPRGTLDVQKLASQRFKKVVDKLRQAMNTPNLTSIQVQQSIVNEFALSVRRAKEIENRHQAELEELAVQAALNVTETPEGKYEIDAKLTGGAGEIGAEGFQFEPEGELPDEGQDEDQEGDEEIPDENQFDVENLTRAEQFELEKHKRNIINGIIQGAAKKGHYIFQKPEIREKIDEIDPNLYGYYLKVMAINDYFYFKLEDMIQDMSQSGQGIEGREDLKSKKRSMGQPKDDEEENGGQEPESQPEHQIIARGLLFPILCHEVIKGIEEALGKFGYSQDPEMRQAVKQQVETLPNEAMSLRIGPELVDRIREFLPMEMFEEENFGIKPFFFMLLYQVPARPFLDLIGKVISQDVRDNREASSKFKEIYLQAKSAKDRYEKKTGKPAEESSEDDIESYLDSLKKFGIGRATDVPNVQPARDIEKPKVELDDKQLSGMGLNALNFELNKAIDDENWDLAHRIQKMIDRKQG